MVPFETPHCRAAAPRVNMVVMWSFPVDQFEVDGNVASVWLTGG
jgi:hypothetical protein